MYIEDYFKQVEEAINAYPLASVSNFEVEKRDTYEGLIRAEVNFIGGSILQVREFVSVEIGIIRDMYSYQYMTSQNTLIFRYDNTPHHQKLNLTTFPHHKHDGQEKNVIASDAPMIWDVLSEIQPQT